MASASGPPRSDARRQVAELAARLVQEHGIRDYGLAKRKAAQQLGLPAGTALPGHAEIEAALRERLLLFDADALGPRLRRLREAALAAMDFLADFSPRLVGAVLEGVPDRHAGVALHVFSDDPGAVARHLDDAGVACRERERRLRLDRDHVAMLPGLDLSADGVDFELTVFPRDGLRQAPSARGTERPMARATRAQVQRLLDESTGERGANDAPGAAPGR